ncbi:MAG TPA: ankyrin repeat domain-containing protein [Steroidobacteraceae bacterium]
MSTVSKQVLIGLLAAVMGHAALAADVDATASDGSTALLWAAHRGDAAQVKRLIAAGANVSLANHYGATPMSEAATQGETDVIALLLKAGADVNSANAEGETALMEVARTGRLDAARLLLSHGANVQARETWGGQTALMWAVTQNHPDMMKLLIQHGAQVNARSRVHDWQRKVTAEGRPKDMHRGGLTPLLYAVRDGCMPCTQILLKAGAELNLPDPDKVSPLEIALLNLHWDMAKFLITQGAEVHGWDEWGQTPLYVAVDMNTVPASGHGDQPSTDKTQGIEVIGMLLDRGANPNAQLMVAPPLRQAVFDRNADQMFTTGATPLLRATRGADIPAMQLLLAHGALVDLPNVDGVTPFLAAAGAGRNVPATRGKFRTEAQAIETAKLLQAAGANVHAATHSGETALHSAALRGWSDMVSYLVQSGVKLDAEAKSGLTPLDYAMGRYQPGFLEPKPAPFTATAALLRKLGAQEEHTHLPPWSGVPTPTITAQIPQ